MLYNVAPHRLLALSFALSDSLSFSLSLGLSRRHYIPGLGLSRSLEWLPAMHLRLRNDIDGSPSGSIKL